MISTRVMCVVALTAATGLGGCQSASRAMGMAKVTPDEFRVVTKAPLVVPPEYALRPPAPGEPRPQELQPESAARNALLPVVTAFALGLGASVGGNVVVETVFAWPGVGRVLVQAVQGADYPVAQGAFILISVVLATMNTVADLLYAALNPKVRL